MSAATDLQALGIVTRARGAAEQRVPCPRCDRGERDDALGVNIDTGLFHCFRCGWSGCAAHTTRTAAPVTRIDDPERVKRLRQRLQQIWSSSVPLSDPAAKPAREYLFHTRRLRPLGEGSFYVSRNALRVHADLPYFDALTHRETGRYPALIAKLTGPGGEPRALHATYLRRDGRGKASVASPKKILGVPARGATKGAAIRLQRGPDSDGMLGVAEGIENAMALAIISSIPTWATYCADNLARVILPDDVTNLYIGVDMDASGTGERVARALAERVSREAPHVSVRLVIPDGTGPRDLNDELMRHANGN